MCYGSRPKTLWIENRDPDIALLTLPENVLAWGPHAAAVFAIACQEQHRELCGGRDMATCRPAVQACSAVQPSQAAQHAQHNAVQVSNPCFGVRTMGTGEAAVPLTEYEIKRQEVMQRNQERMRQLQSAAADLQAVTAKPKVRVLHVESASNIRQICDCACTRTEVCLNPHLLRRLRHERHLEKLYYRRQDLSAAPRGSSASQPAVTAPTIRTQPVAVACARARLRVAPRTMRR